MGLFQTYRAFRGAEAPANTDHVLVAADLVYTIIKPKKTDGSDLCSYRVRGVDGSCAKHLTVLSYTVVMLLTFILIIISVKT